MLVYHHHTIDIHPNARQSSIKAYKSASKPATLACSSISFAGGGPTKYRASRKKKISNANVQLLKGLGLKVKQKN